VEALRTPAPCARHYRQAAGIRKPSHKRTYLKARAEDAADAILSAVEYNFRHILAWLRHLFVPNPGRGPASRASQSALNPASGD
jgi:hypothetical protein